MRNNQQNNNCCELCYGTDSFTNEVCCNIKCRCHRTDSGCRYGEQEPIGTDCQCDLGSEKHYHPDCEYLSEQKGEECKHDIESNCCPAYCKKCGINIDINTPSTPSIGDIDSEKEKLVFWNKLSIVEKADLDFFISALLSSQKNKIEKEAELNGQSQIINITLGYLIEIGLPDRQEEYSHYIGNKLKELE
jgi:hypothetical protein